MCVWLAKRQGGSKGRMAAAAAGIEKKVDKIRERGRLGG